MDEPLVSIIVPLHNCEKTVSRCVEAILSQRYRNLEILLIDDGSTDQTLAYIQNYAGSDNRVRWWTVKNQGVSDTRNFGLKRVHGKYLMFVDGDDYPGRNFVSRMVNLMEGNSHCDMGICSYYRVIDHYNLAVRPLIRKGRMERNSYLVSTLRDPGHHYFGVVWNKIFRTDIVLDNNIRFDPDITLGEDFVFTLQYLLYVSDICVTYEKLYYYVYSERSTLSRIHNKKESDCRAEMMNREKIFRQYVTDFRKTGLETIFRRKMYDYWIMFEIRQTYSVAHEYNWDDAVKKHWIDQMSSEQNIRRAHTYYSQNEIDRKTTVYAVSYKTKQVVKALTWVIIRKKC